MIYKDNINNKVKEVYYGNYPVKQVFYNNNGTMELVWDKIPFSEVIVSGSIVNNYTNVGSAEDRTSSEAWLVGGSWGSSKVAVSHRFTPASSFMDSTLLPSPLSNVAAAYAIGALYVVGGHTPSNTYTNSVRRYFPPSTYTTLTSYGYSAGYLQGTRVIDLALFMGGHSSNGIIPGYWEAYSNPGYKTTNTNGVYARNGYFGRSGSSYAVYAGGVDNNSNSIPTIRFWTATMVSIGSSISLTYAKHNCNGVSLSDGRCIIVGGKNATTVFDICDVISSSQVKLPNLFLNTPTAGHACTENNGYIIIAGGATNTGTTGTSRVEIRDKDTWVLSHVVYMSGSSAAPAAVTVGETTVIMGGNNNKMLVRNI